MSDIRNEAIDAVNVDVAAEVAATEAAVTEYDRWLHLKNAAKRVLAPLAIAASPSAPAIAPAVAQAAPPTHPVHPFVNYDQGDWGSRYASTGCGPTAAAMVAATETGNRRITPHKIGRMLTPNYWLRGSGTRPEGFRAVANRYGLTYQHSNLQEAKDVLLDGGLAIVHAKPGHFTSAGHYMVLKRLHHGRFKIADPNGAPGRDSEVRWWSPRQLKRAGVDDTWTFLPSETA